MSIAILRHSELFGEHFEVLSNEIITESLKEWCLLVLYVVEKAIKLSPSKKDDLVWEMVLKPVVDKIKGK